MDIETLIFNAKTRRKDQYSSDYIKETNGLIMKGFYAIMDRERTLKRYEKPDEMVFWFFQMYYVLLLECDHQISDIAYNAYCSFVKEANMGYRPLTVSEMKMRYKEYLSSKRYLDASNFIAGHRNYIASWNYNDLVYGFTRLMFMGENDINIDEYQLIINLLNYSDDKIMSFEEFRRKAGYLINY